MPDDPGTVLEKLRRLDKSDPEFLHELLHTLQEANIFSRIWSRFELDRLRLIDYLDDVRLL